MFYPCQSSAALYNACLSLVHKGKHKMLFKRCILFTTTAINVVMFSCSLSYAAVADEHQHHQSSQQMLQLNHGVKWQIDQSLHTAMVSIQKHLMLNLDAIHYDKFSNSQFTALAAELDKELNLIVKNCQLAPKADAQLHLLLAKLMQGSRLMRNAEDKKSGAIMVLQALQEYPKYFNDSDWQDIVH